MWGTLPNAADAASAREWALQYSGHMVRLLYSCLLLCFANLVAGRSYQDGARRGRRPWAGQGAKGAPHGCAPQARRLRHEGLDSARAPRRGGLRRVPAGTSAWAHAWRRALLGACRGRRLAPSFRSCSCHALDPRLRAVGIAAGPLVYLFVCRSLAGYRASCVSHAVWGLERPCRFCCLGPSAYWSDSSCSGCAGKRQGGWSCHCFPLVVFGQEGHSGGPFACATCLARGRGTSPCRLACVPALPRPEGQVRASLSRCNHRGRL